mmetsp:Transcript_39949/g.87210  ORF Transcript_39949/g.87210 Transcript_39949/m.87210 type:complete len:215 (-) Transcript_39949:1668-2312(-)
MALAEERTQGVPGHGLQGQEAASVGAGDLEVRQGDSAVAAGPAEGCRPRAPGLGCAEAPEPSAAAAEAAAHEVTARGPRPGRVAACRCRWGHDRGAAWRAGTEASRLPCGSFLQGPRSQRARARPRTVPWLEPYGHSAAVKPSRFACARAAADWATSASRLAGRPTKSRHAQLWCSRHGADRHGSRHGDGHARHGRPARVRHGVSSLQRGSAAI